MSLVEFVSSIKGAKKPAEASPEEAARQLDETADVFRDTTIPMKRVSVYLDRWVQTNFKTEGGQVGGWEPFKYGGRLTESGIDTSAVLLQDTGRLRSSFLPFFSKDEAGIGSDLDYAKKHNDGIGIVQRRILPKKVEVAEDIQKIIVGELVNAIQLKFR